ncbi:MULTISPECIES: arsenate reductase (azurin) small subunit [Halomonadaceae]|uniref:arsenate reductase (azurin) small subunit n=1 Tax=Halomonadaceae TaxID=28256 RepID=UPI000C33C353|nr:arsenate reductase (azurin) small subunit [Halomonas sp. MES3-P3E]PKG51900.1 arsenate reductase (azurin) small subunit [Halomonas sp. MES3-P3E]|tara:strand:+ start:362 stop:880 length:519 start_codon:yes stop_codon:yes gene_type:complete
MTRLSRRTFLKLTGSSAALGTLSLAPITQAEQGNPSAAGNTNLPYPNEVIARLSELTVNQPLYFTYPDIHSPCVVIRRDREVKGGVGPNKDVVAFSTQCTHMGCPVSYDQEAETFKCPCHYSIFDPDNIGQMVIGQATENLPRIILEYDEAEDALRAVSIDGLIYGRQANII